MAPALRNLFAFTVAIIALMAANLAARYGDGFSSGWAWASVILGIVALLSGLYLLILFWRSKP